MSEFARKLFHCYGLRAAGHSPTELAASPALWNCSSEGWGLNVPLRNTQSYFFLFMAEAQCQNNMELSVRCLCLYLLKLQDAISSFCWREVVSILFLQQHLLPAEAAKSTHCQLSYNFCKYFSMTYWKCILQPQAHSVITQFNTNLVNNILNTVKRPNLSLAVLLMIFYNKHISEV